MAEIAAKTVILAVALAVVAGGAADLTIYLADRQTVSEWLRANSRWFWWPAGLMVGFIYLLGFHLFGPEWAR